MGRETLVINQKGLDESKIDKEPAGSNEVDENSEEMGEVKNKTSDVDKKINEVNKVNF